VTRRGAYTPTGAYQKKELAGWKVFVAPEAREHRAEFVAAEAVLARKLAEVATLVPADKVARLRAVPFWLEWRAKPGGAAEYHPSADWLRDHGYNPEKAGGVEINNAVNFVAWQREDQPMMVLHELAHALHHRWLGYDYAPVLQAFADAGRAGWYESVPYRRGGKRRAYGLNNPQEFFAELSEAYFGENDFFPYTREHLRRYDPVGYAAVEGAWREPLPARSG
jgi:hypothetical protein